MQVEINKCNCLVQLTDTIHILTNDSNHFYRFKKHNKSLFPIPFTEVAEKLESLSSDHITMMRPHVPTHT